MKHKYKDIIVPCDCAGCCTIMRADRYWFDSDDNRAYVEFYVRQGEKASLRWRIKNAWSVLRGTDHHGFSSVSISPDDQRRLAEWLMED